MLPPPCPPSPKRQQTCPRRVPEEQAIPLPRPPLGGLRCRFSTAKRPKVKHIRTAPVEHMTCPLDDLRAPGAAETSLVVVLCRSMLGAATPSLVVGAPATAPSFPTLHHSLLTYHQANLRNWEAPNLPFASWFESPRALAMGRVDWVVLRIRTTARATPNGRAMESFVPLPVPLVDAGYRLCLLPCSSSPANGILGFAVVGCTVHGDANLARGPGDSPFATRHSGNTVASYDDRTLGVPKFGPLPDPRGTELGGGHKGPQREGIGRGRPASATPPDLLPRREKPSLGLPRPAAPLGLDTICV
ncbi:hypothetical protein S40293_11173 [Stachybotrys chartarum IBT 40293]|nr:hypothetical protein S40293_11173 [Stachybotrys chartarum IBT 40293]